MYILPNRWRPSGLRYRKLHPGLDLPRWFIDGIRAVDSNLYFIWHPYRVLYEGMMNQYSGGIEESRYTINAHGGEEIWGYILTDNNNRPLPEEKWHCWRLCEPYGWAHVFDIKSKDPDYLKTLLNRLWLQARITEKYGFKAYARYLREEKEKEHEKQLKDEDDLFHDVQKENHWLWSKAMDEYSRGNIKPTNPEKDVIMSYKGQDKRSKITREITDGEGGLVLPDKWRTND